MDGMLHDSSALSELLMFVSVEMGADHREMSSWLSAFRDYPDLKTVKDLRVVAWDDSPTWQELPIPEPVKESIYALIFPHASHANTTSTDSPGESVCR